MKTAAWIITFATLTQILGYLYALPGHIGEPTWSEHAQFHLVLSWFWLIGLDLAILLHAWGPLLRKEKRALETLLALFLFAPGGHFITSLAVPAGRPAEAWYDYALGAQALIFAIGLGLAWRASRPDAAARPPA